MKLNCWLLFGAMLSTSLLAQQVTNAPLAAPLGTSTAAAASAPAQAPAKKSSKKAAPTRKAPGSDLKTVPLVPGPAMVDANNVNVRGQARLKSEIVTRLSKGQPVTVLEEIVRNNSGPEEPSAWAKILLPTNTHVWVHTSFINPATKAVVPRKLNVRSGPGENFSVLGMFLRGETVVDAGGAKGSWLEIQPPTNAYAFVAAQYLKQETAPVLPATPAQPAEVPATPVTVAEPPPVAAAPTEPPSTPPAETPAVTNATPDLAATTNAAPAAEEPPPKRIVERQGVVRGTSSIQAPTAFALYSVDTGRMIDYLYTTSPNLDLRRYKGLQIIVTGEEGLEDRWGNTPVITIQKIQVVE